MTTAKIVRSKDKIPLRNRLKMKIAQGARDLNVKALRSVLCAIDSAHALGYVIPGAKKTRHSHKVAKETTKAGSGVYVERCQCGATRKRIYIGEVENVEPTITAWKKL